jgi:hypothetical protein
LNTSNTVQLESNPALASVIETVEKEKKTVKLRRGSKLVAEIIPGTSHQNSELSDSAENAYRTWGESLSGH